MEKQILLKTKMKETELLERQLVCTPCSFYKYN